MGKLIHEPIVLTTFFFFPIIDLRVIQPLTDDRDGWAVTYIRCDMSFCMHCYKNVGHNSRLSCFFSQVLPVSVRLRRRGRSLTAMRASPHEQNASYAHY